MNREMDKFKKYRFLFIIILNGLLSNSQMKLFLKAKSLSVLGVLGVKDKMQLLCSTGLARTGVKNIPAFGLSRRP